MVLIFKNSILKIKFIFLLKKRKKQHFLKARISVPEHEELNPVLPGHQGFLLYIALSPPTISRVNDAIS